jgi:hypothetical protein
MLSHVLMVTVVLGIAPLLAFSVLNWLSQYMTWPQFGVNFGCWLVGAAGGIVGGVLGARSRAERELVQYPSTALRRP